jgi:hypothetical protein
MLTRKHFKEIAEIIKDNLRDSGDDYDGVGNEAVRSVAKDLASMCARSNKGFDNLRFYRACACQSPGR